MRCKSLIGRSPIDKVFLTSSTSMKVTRLCFSIVCIFIFVFTEAFAAETSRATLPHVTVSFVSDAERIDASSSFAIGLRFELEPGWHIYGKERGDVGLPTKIEWSVPEGLRAHEIQWKKPQSFDSQGVRALGYEGSVLFPSTVSPTGGSELSPSVSLTAKSSWLLCSDECIPQSVTLSMALPFDPESGIKPSAHVGLFRNAFNGAEHVIAGAGETTGEAKTSFAQFLALLALAFLGGLVLNLMPCVFPVLSLKVMGFFQGGDARAARLSGVCYALGIVVSLWGLAGVLVVLRSGGEQLGWGFQFQSPNFVALMGLLTFVIGLNFLGIFEIGNGIQRKAGKYDKKGGAFGSFLSGVLATALATPCTGPFMATALGATLTMSPPYVMATFTSLGLGLASPYVLLAFMPKAIELLPKPGAWMESFKQILSFPMFLTTVWLMSVLGAQAGVHTMALFSAALVLMSFGIWILRLSSQGSSRGRDGFLRPIASVCVILLSLVVGIPDLSRVQATEVGNSLEQDIWQPFTSARFEELRSKGKPILLEVSAAWCLTCQINEKMVYSSSELARELKARGVVAMKADWTKRDSEISKLIEGFGHSGVPLAVLLRGDQEKPKVFSSLVTKEEILDALKAFDIPGKT